MQKDTLTALKIIRVITVIGIVISAPFILFGGLGLIATIPLTLFFITTRRIASQVASNQRLTRTNLYLYIITSILAGLSCMYGFFMMGSLDNIDTTGVPDPGSAPIIFGIPILFTLAFIFVIYRWQKST